jgi:hypothetical protein
MGAQCGLDAWTVAQRYWDGSAGEDGSARE